MPKIRPIKIIFGNQPRVFYSINRNKMKTTVVIILGLVAIAVIVFLILMEILEFIFGAIFILLAIIMMFWLYNRVKEKLE